MTYESSNRNEIEKLPNGISEGLKQAMEDYNRLDTEAMRYLANGSDYFEIQSGAWTLKFDSTPHNRFLDCCNRRVNCDEKKCRSCKYYVVKDFC